MESTLFELILVACYLNALFSLREWVVFYCLWNPSTYHSVQHRLRTHSMLYILVPGQMKFKVGFGILLSVFPVTLSLFLTLVLLLCPSRPFLKTHSQWTSLCHLLLCWNVLMLGLYNPHHLTTPKCKRGYKYFRNILSTHSF